MRWRSAAMAGLSEEAIERLKKAALNARDGSYSPYSNFRVGAALLTTDDEVITGANIENASIGGTICAERTAMVKAVSEGITDFKAIGVSSDLKDFCPPCGICRQFVREFCKLSTPIYMFTADGEYQVRTLEELLPMSFGPESMKS